MLPSVSSLQFRAAAYGSCDFSGAVAGLRPSRRGKSEWPGGRGHRPARARHASRGQSPMGHQEDIWKHCVSMKIAPCTI